MSSRDGAGRPDRRRRLTRLQADRELLACEHPYLAYRLDEARLIAVAHGAVPLVLPDGQVDPIKITVEFHPDYPTSPPRVTDAALRWIPDDDRHIPADHSFCLYLREADEPNLRRPEALRVFLLDVICFLEPQLIYDRIGRFPGPQWPHNRDAYALYIIEQLAGEQPGAATSLWDVIRGHEPPRNSPCPCGGGAKYKRCHLGLVAELSRLATRHDLRGHDYDSLCGFAGVAA